MFESATTRPNGRTRETADGSDPTPVWSRTQGPLAALSQQLALQAFGEPVAVPVLAPATLPDEDMVQRWVVENPDDIARLTNSQAVAQTALFIYQCSESLCPCEAFLTDLRPQLADLRVASGRAVDRFTNR